MLKDPQKQEKIGIINLQLWGVLSPKLEVLECLYVLGKYALSYQTISIK